ncbi:MAG: acyltransferase domain-containing protein, partial [Bryobacteraceae bacterium]
MFSGQGAQHVNMSRDLYETYEVFRRHVDFCSERLRPQLGLDLRSVLYPPGESNATAAQLDQTWLTQPALFTVEYALAQLWMHWGVRPQALLGHSIGEYVAACLAGVMSLNDALSLAADRGRMMQSLRSGAMLSVDLTESDFLPLLRAPLSLAAVNDARSSVVAGPVDAIAELERSLAGREIATRRLHTSHAFHSAMMDPILDAFTERVSRVKLRPPEIPCLSNVTGGWMTAAEATSPAYWAKHLRQTVRFADGVTELCRDAHRFLLEVGPGQTLTSLARPFAGARVAASLRHPKEKVSDLSAMLRAAGQLWIAGKSLDHATMREGEPVRRVPLPAYPF